MNVLLLAENWPPRLGGIERYLVNLFRNLHAEKKIALVPSGSDEKVEGVNVVAHRFFWPVIHPAWWPLFRFAKKLIKTEEVDVLICGKALFEGLLGYYIKKKLGIPYVVCTYAMEIEVWAKDAKTKKKLVKVLTYADAVVYINDKTKRHLLELGVTQEQLVKIQPGVEDRFFEAGSRIKSGMTVDENVLEKYGITKPYVLSVARLIPRKGVDDLITGFAGLDQTIFSDVELVIVGNGPEKEELERLAGREMIAPNFLGAVPDEDLVALFAGAEVFALTPKEVELEPLLPGLRQAKDFEGFGIVYLEANAAGVPVIATRSGGAAEAVIDGKTGLLVDPGKPEEITKALETLLSGDDLRKSLGEQGKVRARDEFSWERQAEKLKNALALLKE